MKILRSGLFPAGVGWLTGISVAAVIGINVAGLLGIAVARRAAAEEAGKELTLRTAARARAIESVLASTRADLAFLTGSPIFFGLEKALGSRDPTEARWRRLEAEGALLIFLRGHPEVTRLAALSGGGEVLTEAARRGGVPVLWVAERPGSGAVRPADRPAAPLTGRFDFATGVRRVSGAVSLDATLDAATLLAGAAAGAMFQGCALRDAAGLILAAEPRAPEGPGGPRADGRGRTGGVPLTAEAPVSVEGWSASSPWTLACAQGADRALAAVEPVAARYRTALALNLAVMSLALLLGAFAVREGRRRQRLEAQAREEARVRELERQLYHAERLSTVGRLAAGMAHEINNPLEGMANYLGLARADLGRGDAAAAQRRLAGVYEGMQRVAAVVGQVLAYADPAVSPGSVADLDDVAAQTVEFVRARREFAGIRFSVERATGPLAVRAGATLLGQVVLNLLVNACEAQPDGGEVRVAARREGGEAVIEIADRGPGVPAADRERIFEPFYSTKRSTGLGLSICHAIVAQHGGTLGVEERPGGGALFRLRLPAAEPGAAGAGGPAAGAGAGGPTAAEAGRG
jgi:signal transduction histidine kinase